VSGRPRLAIVDYGMGNLRSVEKALERRGARPRISRDHEEIRAADGVVLPGVGAFPKAMRNLRDLGLDELVRERVGAEVPTLGICLGMQLLFERSSENEGDDGLGLLPGRVERLPAPGLKVPLIGWNAVRWAHESPLTEGLPDGSPFYFVHSYAPVVAEAEDVLGRADYGGRFVCAVARERLFGVQFHPEKSSAAGLRLLENFAEICATVTAAR
jgi:glutamine amidotransferase